MLFPVDQRKLNSFMTYIQSNLDSAAKQASIKYEFDFEQDKPMENSKLYKYSTPSKFSMQPTKSPLKPLTNFDMIVSPIKSKYSTAAKSISNQSIYEEEPTIKPSWLVEKDCTPQILNRNFEQFLFSNEKTRTLGLFSEYDVEQIDSNGILNINSNRGSLEDPIRTKKRSRIQSGSPTADFQIQGKEVKYKRIKFNSVENENIISKHETNNESSLQDMKIYHRADQWNQFKTASENPLKNEDSSIACVSINTLRHIENQDKRFSQKTSSPQLRPSKLNSEPLQPQYLLSKRMRTPELLPQPPPQTQYINQMGKRKRTTSNASEFIEFSLMIQVGGRQEELTNHESLFQFQSL